MKSVKYSTAFLVFALVAGFTLPANSINVTVPNDREDTEGNGASDVPFISNFTPLRYQQVYDASQFGTTPRSLEGIAFRLNEFESTFSRTIPDIQISLSTTSASPDNLSTTFADNIGTDETVVFNRGSLDLSSDSDTASGTPEEFDITVNFTNPFSYDPNSGNLLLEVKNFSDLSSTIKFDSENTQGDSVSRLINIDNADATQGTTGSVGLVTQFNTTSQPVPFEAEGTMGLVALGGYLFYRYRKKRKQASNQ